MTREVGGLSLLLAKVQSGADLTEAEAEAAIALIVEGGLSPQEVTDFLLALRRKGEALPEIVGAARAMRARAERIDLQGLNPVDTCGTGGDGLKTVNLSTIAALVAAGCGVTVAKHGNRSVTSACGSADLLEALGVAIDLGPSAVERSIRETGFGFLFAPRFHPAMKAVAPVRKELGVPTIFNLLGPLTNPAGVRHQVVGVADGKKLQLYAEALKGLGVVRALVVHGLDGQDEISTTGPTEVVEINVKMDPDRMARYTLDPRTFGIQRAGLDQLRGGSPAENGRIAEGVLSGRPGPVREAVLLNAAAALYVAGAAGDLDNGLALASQAIDRGRALAVLEAVRRITHE
ncbi:MAG: anthranilate phosphoribosyltransferase [Candidatus Omnitrophica bacterium]|nr:anthranilate phosphoribosyltransferase [Candidatus Omnitrophota bacterium]